MVTTNPFTGEVLQPTPGVNRPELQTNTRAQNRVIARAQIEKEQVEQQDREAAPVAQHALDTLKSGGTVEFSKTSQGLQVAMQQQKVVQQQNSAVVTNNIGDSNVRNDNFRIPYREPNSNNIGNDRIMLGNQQNISMDKKQNILTEFKYNNFAEKKLNEWQTSSDYIRLKNPLLSSAIDVGIGATETVYTLGKTAYSLVTSPIKTTKELSLGIFSAVSNPQKTILDIAKVADERPGKFIGEVGVDIATGKIALTAANKATIAARSATAPLRAGFEYVPIESIADTKVLLGDEFPMSPSPQAALKEFKELGTQSDTTLLATNARPIGLPNVISAGEKGVSAREDAVLYVAPYTRGSPLFLRTAGTKYEGITLNPFKVVNPA